MSLGPADLAASRGMKTTRVGGGHPAYGMLADAGARRRRRAPSSSRTCGTTRVGTHGRRLPRLRHQAVLRPVRRLLRPGRVRGAVPQRLPAGLRRRLDAASDADRHRQARVQPRPGKEVAFAKRILEAMPDGTGAAMIDGKMQDDATWKQAKVILDLAKLVADQGPRAQGALRPVDPQAVGIARHSRMPQFDRVRLTAAMARYSSGDASATRQATVLNGHVSGRRNSRSGRWCATASTRSAASSSTSIRCSTTPRNGGWRSRARCARTRTSRSIICWPRTRKRNTSPTSRSRTCCPTPRGSRCAIRRSSEMFTEDDDGSYRPLFLQHPH